MPRLHVLCITPTYRLLVSLSLSRLLAVNSNTTFHIISQDHTISCVHFTFQRLSSRCFLLPSRPISHAALYYRASLGTRIRHLLTKHCRRTRPAGAPGPPLAPGPGRKGQRYVYVYVMYLYLSLALSLSLSLSMYIYIYIYMMRICIYIMLCTYVCMYVCMYIYIYIYMYNVKLRKGRGLVFEDRPLALRPDPWRRGSRLYV